MTQIKSVYTLIKKDVPKIKGKHILSDARVGGEKLVYERVSYPIFIWLLFNLFKIHIPLVLHKKKFGGIGINLKKKETVVYLRPYKKNWTKKKERLPFCLWGKKDHPLTNIWLELEYDFEDIMKKIPLMKSQVEDHSLIKFLRQHKENFILISNQNKSK